MQSSAFDGNGLLREKVREVPASRYVYFGSLYIGPQHSMLCYEFYLYLYLVWR